MENFPLEIPRLLNSAKPESEALVAMENFPLERLTSSCHALKPLQATSDLQVAEARLPSVHATRSQPKDKVRYPNTK
jgi:hypothetical protein